MVTDNPDGVGTCFEFTLPTNAEAFDRRHDGLTPSASAVRAEPPVMSARRRPRLADAEERTTHRPLRPGAADRRASDLPPSQCRCEVPTRTVSVRCELYLPPASPAPTRSTSTCTAARSSCGTPGWTTSSPASWSPSRGSPCSRSTTTSHRRCATRSRTSRPTTSPQHVAHHGARAGRRRQTGSASAASAPAATSPPRSACRRATGQQLRRRGSSCSACPRSTSRRSTPTSSRSGHRCWVAGILDLVRATYFRDASAAPSPTPRPCWPRTWPTCRRRWSSPPSSTCSAREGDAYAARGSPRRGCRSQHRVVPGRDHYFLDPANARTEMDLMGPGGTWRRRT